MQVYDFGKKKVVMTSLLSRFPIGIFASYRSKSAGGKLFWFHLRNTHHLH